MVNATECHARVESSGGSRGGGGGVVLTSILQIQIASTPNKYSKISVFDSKH